MKNLSVSILLVLASSALCTADFAAAPATTRTPRVAGDRKSAVKPLAQVKRLAVTDLTVKDAAAGAPGGQPVEFWTRVTVQEAGRCSIGFVRPAVLGKTADGRTEPVRVIAARDAYCIQGGSRSPDSFLNSAGCRMTCDELRGGQATLEFGSRSDQPLPALSQIGVCFEFDGSSGNQQECTWYPLETVTYYRLKK